MKALTTSELNQLLISKGLKSNYSYNLPTNKWNADSFTFNEGSKGISYLNLTKKVSEYTSTKVESYSKMNASDKKEFASIILNNK
jgi:hypothetical protein